MDAQAKIVEKRIRDLERAIAQQARHLQRRDQMIASLQATLRRMKAESDQD